MLFRSKKNLEIVKLPSKDYNTNSFFPKTNTAVELKFCPKKCFKQILSTDIALKSKVDNNCSTRNGAITQRVRIKSRTENVNLCKVDTNKLSDNTVGTPTKKFIINIEESVNNMQTQCLTSRDFASNIPLKPSNKIEIPMANYDKAKCSLKNNGIIKAYAVNTNQGIVRYLFQYSIGIIMKIVLQ